MTAPDPIPRFSSLHRMRTTADAVAVSRAADRLAEHAGAVTVPAEGIRRQAKPMPAAEELGEILMGCAKQGRMP